MVQAAGRAASRVVAGTGQVTGWRALAARRLEPLTLSCQALARRRGTAAVRLPPAAVVRLA